MSIAGGIGAMRSSELLHRLLVKALAHCRKQSAADGEIAVGGIFALHHDPWCGCRAGLAQREFTHLAEFIVLLETFSVRIGDAPARLRIFLQRLEAFFLAVLG